MASLGGSREAQRLCRRKEIPHLVHFHERLPIKIGTSHYSRIGSKRGL